MVVGRAQVSRVDTFGAQRLGEPLRVGAEAAEDQRLAEVGPLRGRPPDRDAGRR